MSKGIRLKSIRKALALNQTDFGARINLSQTTIGQYEKETRPITERVISQLVSEFHINEEYLRHGTGDMFIDQTPKLVRQLADELSLSDREQHLLLTFLSFPPETRAQVLDFAQEFVVKLQQIGKN
ncbi:helix-turn-helix domain-containing protein [Selenomonas sp. KH1T6]|uniref:helix-turn-helix domain-containing protein n=1 Tax=Selenomonas sp. KH1T6 TaxID=3158784 RepID=UPI0008A7F93C|nr:Helix-turn-helix [Selenomonas ruminantium]